MMLQITSRFYLNVSSLFIDAFILNFFLSIGYYGCQ